MLIGKGRSLWNYGNVKPQMFNKKFLQRAYVISRSGSVIHILCVPPTYIISSIQYEYIL